MDDKDVKFVILAGLPSEYSHTSQIIKSNSNVDLEEVRSLLLSAVYEIELKYKSSPLPLLAVMMARNVMFHNSQHNSPLNSSRGVTQNGRNGFTGHNSGNYAGNNNSAFSEDNGGGYSIDIGSSKNYRTNGEATGSNPIICQICEKPGRSAWKCRQRKTQPIQNGASTSTVPCQICNNSDHTAQICPQRSSPKQVCASESYMQCQIFFEIGHSAIECICRHQYGIQSKYLSATFCTQSKPPSIATHLNINNQGVVSSVTKRQEDVGFYTSELSERKEYIDLHEDVTAYMEKNASMVATNKKVRAEVVEDSLDKVIPKPMDRLERNTMQGLAKGNNYACHILVKRRGNNRTGCENLDKFLVKQVSRLEKEKLQMKLGDFTKIDTLYEALGGFHVLLLKDLF